MSIYSKYQQYVKTIIQTKNLSNFKSHPNYTYILEHVDRKKGIHYLNFIRSQLSMEKIKEYCTLNDRIGSPKKEQFGDLFCSPSSLRYLAHSLMILKQLKGNEIIEIGCGYGGLCLCLKFLRPELIYHCIDLPEPLQLQKLYLESLNNVFFHSTDDINLDGFIVSSYCYSEISPEFREKYKPLLLRSIGGWFAWNNIPPQLPRDFQIEHDLHYENNYLFY